MVVGLGADECLGDVRARGSRASYGFVHPQHGCRAVEICDDVPAVWMPPSAPVSARFSAIVFAQAWSRKTRRRSPVG